MSDTNKLTQDEQTELTEFQRLGDRDDAERQAAPGDAPAEPPPASMTAPAGAALEKPPAGEVAAAPEAAALPVVPLTPEQLANSVLIETPTQGVAVERNLPIPTPDAEPILPASRLEPADEASAPGAEAPPEIIPNHEEHPADTIQRIRMKLAAYGAECLETVRPELEYLLSLCQEPGE
jgi:hypothetical protein